jgi:hypothetical protein
MDLISGKRSKWCAGGSPHSSEATPAAHSNEWRWSYLGLEGRGVYDVRHAWPTYFMNCGPALSCYRTEFCFRMSHSEYYRR